MTAGDANGLAVDEITVRDLDQRLKDGLNGATLIDVREPHEWEIVHLDAAKLMPRLDLPSHLGELSQTDELLVMCRSGVRSGQAAVFLKQMGFKRVKNVRGGILAWAREIDPAMPTY